LEKATEEEGNTVPSISAEEGPETYTISLFFTEEQTVIFSLQNQLEIQSHQLDAIQKEVVILKATQVHKF